MRTLSLEGDRLTKVVQALGNCPLFGGLTPDQLARVAAAALLVQFEPGEALMTTGEASDGFDVLVGGLCSVRVAGPNGESREVSQLRTHDAVGEMGLLLDRPRTADVVALERTLAVRFRADAFRQLFEKLPAFGQAVCRALAERLHGASRSMPMPEITAVSPPSPEVLGLLPADFIAHHRLLPLATDGNRLTIGCVDDVAPRVLEAVRGLLPGMEVQAARISATFFEDTLRGRPSIMTSGFGLQAQPTVAPASSPQLDALLRRVVAEGASDLHLSARHRPRWRIDGEMHELAD